MVFSVAALALGLVDLRATRRRSAAARLG
jgi:hypothetical protein